MSKKNKESRDELRLFPRSMNVLIYFLFLVKYELFSEFHRQTRQNKAYIKTIEEPTLLYAVVHPSIAFSCCKSHFFVVTPL